MGEKSIGSVEEVRKDNSCSTIAISCMKKEKERI